MLKKIIPIILIVLALIINICSANVKISFLDVGQGDATLIQTDSQNILIDTSDIDEKLKLERELYRLGAFKLDKIILTHPHSDHIGNAAYLVKSGVINVKSVYDNGVISTSKYYLNYVTECAKRNVRRGVLRAGDVLDLGGGCTFTVYNPPQNGYSDVVNDNSIVGRLDYGDFSVLFTGDAESAVEENLIDELQPVKILKAGHHGSRTSSSVDFLNAISPEYAIISAGQPGKKHGNTFGHPHVETLENLIYAGVEKNKILWTWVNGTIEIESDGNTYTVTPRYNFDWVDRYILGEIGYKITKL